MSEPMPSIPTQSPFTYPNPNPSASPSFTQDDTSDSFIPEPTQPIPTYTQPAFSQPNQSFFSQPAVHLTQPSQTNPNNVQSQQFQQFQTATISANNAKFPYLEKEKYEIWAMKMEYWIQNADHNLWRIVQQGNSPKRLGKDAKGNTIVHPPVSLDEHVAVQRENKVRTLLLQALPEDHMPDFHHYDDARDILERITARFGGNEESKKNEEDYALNISFAEFSVTEEEAYISYGVKVAAVPTHSGFIGTACSGSKPTYSDQQRIVPSVSQTSGRSDNVIECVLHSFVAENEQDQDMIYEDFDQVDQTKNELQQISSLPDLTEEKLDVTNVFNWDILLGSVMLGKCMLFLPPITGTYNAQPITSLTLRKTHLQTPLRPMHPMIQASRHRQDIPPAVDIPDFPESDIIPAASRNRPAVNPADRPHPAGWSKRPATVSAGRPVSAGWLNPAARPLFRPSSVYNDESVKYIYPMIKDDGELLLDSVRLLLEEYTTTILGGDPSTDMTSTLTCFKNNYVRVKKCFVCGSKLYLIKDCDKSKGVDFVPCKSKAASAPAGSRNSPASVSAGGSEVTAGRSGPAASRNRPAVNSAGSPNPAGWSKRPAPVEELQHFNLFSMNVSWNKGKQHKASYKRISAERLITETLQLLHMDLFGPTNIRSIDQKYYSLVVTDDFSRFSWTFYLSTKDETFYVLKEFISLIENQLNKKVKGIRCDNGTEFKNAKLIELCGEKGIKRDYSNPRTPQQNGVAERKNRTLIEAARTMLADSKLPTMFWTEAGKADDGYLVGYASNSKAYRVYNLPNKRVEETLNLRFLEDKPNVQGIGHEWYFDLDYLTDSLGYTRFKTDTPAGTYGTNINAGTQDHDSDSEVDEQVIVVPSFPSNRFAGPSSSSAHKSKFGERAFIGYVHDQ
ncbi:putative ribonuclease H-like domain-containing protein [Tanacetum coccineum]